jgi:hypothetical protein
MTGDVAPGARRRTWLYIVGGVVVVGIVFVLAAATAGFLLFRSNVQTMTVGPAAAEAEFERTLAPFANEQPLLGRRGEEPRADLRRRERRPIDQLHVMAYDPTDERLVNITVPGWLLRLAPHGESSIKIDGTDVLESAGGRRITIEDLERHGPGLVLDQHGYKGTGRVVVWSE